jgi:hypothetical protein
MSDKKRQWRDQAVVAIAELEKRWPNCFSVYEPRRRPLALGIHDPILESGCPSEGLGGRCGAMCRASAICEQ